MLDDGHSRTSDSGHRACAQRRRSAATPLLALCFVVVGGCAKSVEPTPDKNTNWLQTCGDGAECGEGARCLCGICTRVCDSAARCGGGDVSAACVPVVEDVLSDQCAAHGAGDAEAVCAPACEDDTVCLTLLGSEGSCRAGICVRSMPQTIPPDLEQTDADLVAGGLDATDVAADSSQVVWIDASSFEQVGLDPTVVSADGAVVALSLTDGTQVTLASDRVAPRAIVLDPAHAYWLEEQRVIRASRAGDGVEVLAELSTSPIGGLAVDDTYVYWMQLGEAPDVPDEVWRLAKDRGRDPERVLLVEPGASQLQVDATHIYWFEARTAHRAFKDGTQNEVIGETLGTKPGVWSETLLQDDAFYGMFFQDEGGFGLWAAMLPPDGRALDLGRFDGFPEGIAGDGEHLYWVQQDEGGFTLARTGKTTASTEFLLRTDAPISNLAVSGADIYFTRRDRGRGALGSPRDGGVYRMPK